MSSGRRRARCFLVVGVSILVGAACDNSTSPSGGTSETATLDCEQGAAFLVVGKTLNNQRLTLFDLRSGREVDLGRANSVIADGAGAAIHFGGPFHRPTPMEIVGGKNRPLPWPKGAKSGVIATTPDGSRYALTRRDDSVSELSVFVRGAAEPEHVLRIPGEVDDLTWWTNGRLLATVDQTTRVIEGSVERGTVALDGAKPIIFNLTASSSGLLATTGAGTRTERPVSTDVFDSAGKRLGGIRGWRSVAWDPSGTRHLVFDLAGLDDERPARVPQRLGILEPPDYNTVNVLSVKTKLPIWGGTWLSTDACRRVTTGIAPRRAGPSPQQPAR